MDSIITKQPDGTIKLAITIPAKEVDETRSEIIESFAKQAQIPGFRKGKAPKKLAEGKVNIDTVNEELIRTLLPKHYSDAIKKHNLNPILNPKVHIEKLEEGVDLKFTAETCEAPIVDLGAYKDEIKKITAKSKIIIPGKEKEEINFDTIMEELLKSAKVTVPAIIIEQETQRLLAQTLDEVKRLGLSLEQYLSSTGRTTEDLKREYGQKAENDIKIEFVLQKVAQIENITVEEKEIEEAIAKAKDENERKNLEGNKYLLASILRQQKTLDFLKSL